MVFKRLRTGSSKKKILGALIVIAFVAFFANMTTRYIVFYEIDMILAGLAAIVIICILLLVMELRRRKKRRPARKISKRKRR